VALFQGAGSNQALSFHVRRVAALVAEFDMPARQVCNDWMINHQPSTINHQPSTLTFDVA
jgi:hypothetical protein